MARMSKPRKPWLQRGGIDMHTLSIVGKDTHTDEHAVGYRNTGDRMKY